MDHGEKVACSHGDGGREKRGHEVERDDSAELLAHLLLGLGERADDEHEHEQRGDRLERADEQFAEDADAGSGHGGVGDQQGERRADGHADDDAQHETDAVVGFDEFHFFLLLFPFAVLRASRFSSLANSRSNVKQRVQVQEMTNPQNMVSGRMRDAEHYFIC